jgi:hypothetical protein
VSSACARRAAICRRQSARGKTGKQEVVGSIPSGSTSLRAFGATAWQASPGEGGGG